MHKIKMAILLNPMKRISSRIHVDMFHKRFHMRIIQTFSCCQQYVIHPSLNAEDKVEIALFIHFISSHSLAPLSVPQNTEWRLTHILVNASSHLSTCVLVEEKFMFNFFSYTRHHVAVFSLSTILVCLLWIVTCLLWRKFGTFHSH